MKTSENPTRPVSGKKLSKTEAKAIVGGKSVRPGTNKSKLQSSTGIS